ncbi:MAG: ABC transporter permease [Ardenticatenaceae bacterium]|nr:ABC transporter permease [Ardenticatenaceae bacterium]HBY96762.1 ABC transporter permease [Chloroflexota bacterium]
MLKILIRRLAHSVLVLWGISTIVFVLIHLSGDPTNLMLPPDATYEQRAEFRHRMGFDRPLAVQYIDFLGHAVRLDFGESIRHNQPAMQLVLERVPATLQLSGVALLIAFAIAVPLGVLAAIKRASWFDTASLLVALTGQSFPVFWLGIMLILIFSENLHWLPSSGRGDWKHLVLPSLTLSALSTAMIMRILRSSLLEVLASDYIRTAKAKGLPDRIIIYKHALRNAAIPVVTIVGLSIGMMLGGAVITETVFAWPGMGRLAIQAISNRDFPVVQSFVIFTAVVILVINLIVDLLYTWIDPRIRVT